MPEPNGKAGHRRQIGVLPKWLPFMTYTDIISYEALDLDIIKQRKAYG